jgi:predicted ATPase
MKHFEQLIALYDPERHRTDVLRYALNPGVAAYSFAACTAWYLGQPDKALTFIDEALALAQAMSEPHGLAYAHFLAAVVHQLRREERLTQARAEAALAVAGEHELPLFAAFALVLRGWALAGQGRAAEGIEQMHQGLAAQRMTGTLLVRPHLLALLAEALGHAGQAEAGLRALDEALVLTEQTGERDYEAELHRLKGELLLRRAVEKRGSSIPRGETSALTGCDPSAHGHAKACFSKAMEIAHRQQASSWELRAAMSLSCLQAQKGERAKARQMLQAIYGSFAEGFGTRDLQEAKTQLETLS